MFGCSANFGWLRTCLPICRSTFSSRNVRMSGMAGTNWNGHLPSNRLERDILNAIEGIEVSRAIPAAHRSTNARVCSVRCWPHSFRWVAPRRAREMRDDASMRARCAGTIHRATSPTLPPLATNLPSTAHRVYTALAAWGRESVIEPRLQRRTVSDLVAFAQLLRTRTVRQRRR